VAGRFGLALLALTLAVYLPYFYQSGRFLLGGAAFLGLRAAALVAEATSVALAMRLKFPPGRLS
jgi:hypothetical protein